MVVIVGTLSLLEFIEISWLPRSATKITHWIAYVEKHALLPKDWPSSPLKGVINILLLHFDRIGVG